MKGKKVDRDFLNNFMNECLKNGISSSEGMTQLAKNQIESIDYKIKEIEDMKSLRCKLLDVVSSFEKKDKQISDGDHNILLFYKIYDVNISKNICKMLIDNGELPLKFLEDNIRKPKHDVYFCVKQMIAIGVLNKQKNSLTKGCLFDKYFVFIGNR